MSNNNNNNNQGTPNPYTNSYVAGTNWSINTSTYSSYSGTSPVWSGTATVWNIPNTKAKFLGAIMLSPELLNGSKEDLELWQKMLGVKYVLPACPVCQEDLTDMEAILDTNGYWIAATTLSLGVWSAYNVIFRCKCGVTIECRGECLEEDDEPKGIYFKNLVFKRAFREVKTEEFKNGQPQKGAKP